MFEWQGLPQTIPKDYLERTLIRHGHVMFYYDENIGLDVLRCEVTGFNRHDEPTKARSNIYSTIEILSTIERNLKRLTDSESVEQEFDQNTDAVLISNMSHGQNASMIVEHFAEQIGRAHV